MYIYICYYIIYKKLYWNFLTFYDNEYKHNTYYKYIWYGYEMYCEVNTLLKEHSEISKWKVHIIT